MIYSTNLCKENETQKQVFNVSFSRVSKIVRNLIFEEKCIFNKFRHLHLSKVLYPKDPYVSGFYSNYWLKSSMLNNFAEFYNVLFAMAVFINTGIPVSEQMNSVSVKTAY